MIIEQVQDAIDRTETQETPKKVILIKLSQDFFDQLI